MKTRHPYSWTWFLLTLLVCVCLRSCVVVIVICPSSSSNISCSVRRSVALPLLGALISICVKPAPSHFQCHKSRFSALSVVCVALGGCESRENYIPQSVLPHWPFVFFAVLELLSSFSCFPSSCVLCVQSCYAFTHPDLNLVLASYHQQGERVSLDENLLRLLFFFYFFYLKYFNRNSGAGRTCGRT